MFWEQAYRDHAPMMLGACLRYIPDRPLAEDLMHDAFVAAINKAGTYDGRGCFAAWLRRIAVNTALMHLRGLRPSVSYETLIDNENTEPMEQEPAYGQLAPPDLSHQQLLEIIGQLPENHRMVFNLYVIDDFSHEQISQQLNISTGTSKSHLARARKRLRQLLLSHEDAEQRRRLPLLFILPFGWNNVDSFFKNRLAGYAAVPDSAPGFMDAVDWNTATVPRPQLIPARTNWVGAGAAASAAVILASGVYFYALQTSETAVPAAETVPIADSVQRMPAQMPIAQPSAGEPSAAPPQTVVVRQTIIEHQTVVVRDTITVIDTADAL